MKYTQFLVVAIVIAISILIPPSVYASSNANIIYNETDLKNGWWQYDYIFYNNSTSGESLYSIWFDFPQRITITGSPLPDGWHGIKWEGINSTAWIDAFSTDTIYDIASGSSLDGFSFKTNYQAGNITYTAYFDDHAEHISSISGTTALLVPEPVSFIFFIAGGVFLAGRRYLRRQRKT